MDTRVVVVIVIVAVAVAQRGRGRGRTRRRPRGDFVVSKAYRVLLCCARGLGVWNIVWLFRQVVGFLDGH